MNTFGYDLLVQADERLLNKALSALFYTGKLKASGTYAFVKGVPQELLGFTQVDYKIRLRNEPFLDFLDAGSEGMSGKIGIRLSVEVILRVLTGIDVEIDVDFGATTQIGFTPETSKIKYDMVNAEIFDIKINDKIQFHRNVIDRINVIIGILLKHYITEDVKEILLPFDLNKLELDLPEVPTSPDNQLPVKFAEAMILDKRIIAVGVNFFNHERKSFSEVTDQTQGSELYIALKTDAMAEIADFWWKKTNIEKKVSFDGSLPINAKRVLSQGSDLFLRAITLGFLQPKTQVNKAHFNYKVQVNIEDLPEISFDTGQYIKMSKLKLKLTIKAHIETEVHKVISFDTSGFIPDTLTPWKDDTILSDKVKKEEILQIEDEIEVEAHDVVCSIEVDDQNRLVLKVISADLTLDFGNRWYENFTDKIMNAFLDFLDKILINKIPKFIISPSLLLSDVSVMGYTFEVNIQKLNLQKEEISLCTNMSVKELQSKAVPVALYIGNTKSLKLHRFDCHVVEDIDFTHRVGYHIVYDAIHEGYSPCKECLLGYLEITDEGRGDNI